MVQLFYTIYISVDLAHQVIFHAKVGKGGIIIKKTFAGDKNQIRYTTLIISVTFLVCSVPSSTVMSQSPAITVKSNGLKQANAIVIKMHMNIIQ